MTQAGRQAPYQDGIPVVQNSTDRALRFPNPVTDQRVHNLTSGAIERWTAGGWSADLIAPRVFDVKVYGATGDGTTDDHAAIAACASAASTAATTAGIKTTVVVPPGVICLTNSPIDWPENVDLRLEGAIKAGAVMAYVLQTPLNTLAEDQAITGSGFIYCNSKADVGIDLQYTRHFRVEGVCVEDYLVAGIRSGNSGAGGTSYETIIHRARTHRRSASVPVGAIGIYLRSATDSHVSDCVVIGAEYGVRVDSSSNHFARVHCWVRSSTGVMLKGFLDNGIGNTFVDCYADTPTVYGFHFTAFSSAMFGCSVQNTVNGGLDNVMSGVRYDLAAPSAICVGTYISGADASHRVLKDFDFGSGNGGGVEVYGTRAGSNVSTVYGGGINAIKLRRAQTFTVSSGTASKTVADTRTSANSLVMVTPANAAAATVMGSTKAIYQSAVVASTSFTFTTGDGTNVAADAVFNYLLLD